MKYRVGQKVRQLHAAGEGVITALLDANTVEVDFGDDFPMDVDISEIIPVDAAESRYLGTDATGTVVSEQERDPEAQKPLALGTALLDVSLVLVPEEQDRFRLVMANPEPTDILYAVYQQDKKQYQGLAASMLASGSVKDVATLSGAELLRTRAFFVQVINFVVGRGHPHTPLSVELPWNKGRTQQPAKYLEAVATPAWVFPLRKGELQAQIEEIDDSEFIRVVRQEQTQQERHMEVDLHLEEIVDDPVSILPGEALRLQMEAVARALSDALVQHAATLILIHGVGEGKLRKEVEAMLRRTSQVKHFEPADHRRYGSGATKVYFH